MLARAHEGVCKLLLDVPAPQPSRHEPMHNEPDDEVPDQLILGPFIRHQPEASDTDVVRRWIQDAPGELTDSDSLVPGVPYCNHAQLVAAVTRDFDPAKPEFSTELRQFVASDALNMGLENLAEALRALDDAKASHELWSSAAVQVYHRPPAKRKDLQRVLHQARVCAKAWLRDLEVFERENSQALMTPVLFAISAAGRKVFIQLCASMVAASSALRELHLAAKRKAKKVFIAQEVQTCGVHGSLLLNPDTTHCSWEEVNKRLEDMACAGCPSEPFSTEQLADIARVLQSFPANNLAEVLRRHKPPRDSRTLTMECARQLVQEFPIMAVLLDDPTKQVQARSVQFLDIDKLGAPEGSTFFWSLLFMAHNKMHTLPADKDFEFLFPAEDEARSVRSIRTGT